MPIQSDDPQGQGGKWDANGDGVLSLGEANSWYRNGNGSSITVDASKVDLSHVDPKTFSKVGDRQSVNLLRTGPASVGLVYGSIGLVYLGNNRVQILSDEYDFRTGASDNHPWFESFWGFIRNVETVGGNIIAGPGTPYSINFSGYATINKVP